MYKFNAYDNDRKPVELQKQIGHFSDNSEYNEASPLIYSETPSLKDSQTTRRLLVILLGASKYLYNSELSNIAFKRSCDEYKKLLGNEDYQSIVSPEDILDLFDSEKSASDMDNNIFEWLKNKNSRKNGTATPPSDLLVFYIGHGGFKNNTEEYFLAIKKTTKERGYFHSIAMENLCGTLRDAAPRMRRFLIIDACFSASVVKYFQSPGNDAVAASIRKIQQNIESIPKIGTAVLCSSSSTSTSTINKRGLTMFSDGLITILKEGDKACGNFLTLSEISTRVQTFLIDKHQEKAVRPEIHSPDQRKGSLSEIPLFPNAARRRSKILPVVIKGRDQSDIQLNMAFGNPSNADSDPANKDNYLIEKPQYCMSYNNARGIANWVSWHLRRSDLGTVERASSFFEDPILPKEFKRVKTSDYIASNYDRGHLCPPGDRKGSELDQKAVFQMTNVIPQARIRNQKLWHALEVYCREIVEAGYQLFIIAGHGGVDRTIRNGLIAVPTFIWKIIVVMDEAANPSDLSVHDRIIAMRMANRDVASIDDWRECVVSVGSLEDDLGYTFFSHVSSSLKKEIKKIHDRG